MSEGKECNSPFDCLSEFLTQTPTHLRMIFEKKYKQSNISRWKDINILGDFFHDEVAEWLRRWTANPLGSPRVGSNPILVD